MHAMENSFKKADKKLLPADMEGSYFQLTHAVAASFEPQPQPEPEVIGRSHTDEESQDKKA